jgi:carbonic anhydrase
MRLPIPAETMHRLIAVDDAESIPPEYRGTPVGRLLSYHNLEAPFDHYEGAELLVGMCMDHRKQLRIPEQFAYVLRTGGANLRYSEFKVSFAIAVGGVRAIALIGHSDCGMVNVMGRLGPFVEGLVERAGWDEARAEEHFHHYAPMFEIGNAVDFTLSEAKRLRLRYPGVLVAPLHYKVEDNRLYLIEE